MEGEIVEKWGYVRVSVSKTEQAAGWNDQIATLKALGCTRFFYEEASTRHERPVFETMQREANQKANSSNRICIVSAKLDRAFRDLSAADAAITHPINPHVIWLLPDLSPNPLDPKDPTQMLLVRMMGAVAQFERDRLAERRAYGIVKAKAEGKYKGRAPTARAKAADVLRYKDRGFKPDEIATQLGIGRASVYRILKEHGSV
jgi:DNA invertase Pin-like site-specific DNA recombinase